MASLAVSVQMGQQLKIGPHVDRRVAIDPPDVRTQQALVAHVVRAVVVHVQIARVVRSRDLPGREVKPERPTLVDSSTKAHFTSFRSSSPSRT